MQNTVSRDPRHRNELLAAGAVLIVLVHILFAQLTALVAVCCHLTGKVTGWRPTWLFVPVGAGAVWAAAVGPRPAVAGLFAAPAHVLGYFTSSSGPAPHLTRMTGLLAGAGNWLPRQLPLALLTGAAEAAAILIWRPVSRDPMRPGPWEVLRRRLNLRRLHDGQLRVRDAVVLGVDHGTGAPACLRWDVIEGGVLIAGPSETELTGPAFRLVEAAIRFRKPVIVVDLSCHAAIMTMLRDVCVRNACPMEVRREASQVELGALVRDRGAAVFPLAGELETARRVCGEMVDTARRLRRIGVRGDGVVWLRCCAGLPRDLVAGLIAEGALAGLGVLLTTTDVAAVSELEQRVSAVAMVTAAGDLRVLARGAEPVRAVTR